MFTGDSIGPEKVRPLKFTISKIFFCGLFEAMSGITPSLRSKCFANLSFMPGAAPCQ